MSVKIVDYSAVMIYLCSCLINNKKPNEKVVKNLDMDLCYKAAKFHSITAIMVSALENAGVTPSWSEAKGVSLRKTLMFDIEREEILKYMDRAGIWYAPLKGTILKDLYPSPEMRQMSDNDILIDPGKRAYVRKIMVSKGYEVSKFGKGIHDAYSKKPFFYYEMHNELFTKKYLKLNAYYKNVKSRLIKDKDNKMGYHFSDEDFYVYMVAHEYKHYSLGGTGIRSLIDRYVFLKAKGKTLNKKYIEKQLRILDLANYDRQVCGLVDKIFSNDENFLDKLNNSQREMFKYFATAGTYGTVDNEIENKVRLYSDKKLDRTETISGKTKLKFLFGRIFPDVKTMQQFYPQFCKPIILLPVGYVYRLFRGIILKRDIIRRELKFLLKNKTKGGAKKK